MNDLVRFEQRAPQTAISIRQQVNLIQEVMQAVMKEGTHYGKIPGTPKPSLWKPGAEVLAATFHIAPSYRIEDLSGHDFIRYRIACVGTHQGSGIVMGEGMGECSSLEEKYKWRKASNRREFDSTPEDRRRIKYGYNKEERREYETQQVRAECADQANTILKMACKRAQVAMTLNVTAASDIFTQDIEDLPEELRPEDEDQSQQREPVQGPRAKKPATTPAAEVAPLPSSEEASGLAGGAGPDDKPLTDGAKKTLTAAMARAGRTEADLTSAGFPKIDAMKFVKFNDAMKWLKEHPAV